MKTIHHSSIDLQVKRIVIKVGSRLLVDDQGRASYKRIAHLINEIHALRQAGIEVILVSSGAVGAGMSLLEMQERPKNLPDLQAAAAVGQSYLMEMYQSTCRAHGFTCGQLLLTSDDVNNRHRHLNFSHCLNALLERDILPIINENDSVSVDEICFGDNDRLGALVSLISRSDLLFLMTGVNGMLQLNDDGSLGERIPVIKELDDAILNQAIGTEDAVMSTGGMKSKLSAAAMLMRSGQPVWIADGNDFSTIGKLIDGADLGTLILPHSNRMTSAKNFLAFFTNESGSVAIDKGATKALLEKGASLLPKGIQKLDGTFEQGDIIHILDTQGQLIAKGVSNYNREDLEKLILAHSSEFKEILGFDAYSEAVHRDNMVIL